MHRQRFAGKDGFIDGEVVDFEEARIGGDARAVGEMDDVSGHEQPRIDLLFDPASHDAGTFLDVGRQLLERTFRAVFLIEA